MESRGTSSISAVRVESMATRKDQAKELYIPTDKVLEGKPTMVLRKQA